MKIIARHVPSGNEKLFDNFGDMSDYITPEIRTAWVYYFRYDNGFQTPYKPA